MTYGMVKAYLTHWQGNQTTSLPPPAESRSFYSCDRDSFPIPFVLASNSSDFAVHLPY